MTLRRRLVHSNTNTKERKKETQREKQKRGAKYLLNIEISSSKIFSLRFILFD